LHPVTDVACWLTGISKRARDFHIDGQNINVSLRSLAVKIIAKTRRERGKQQLASVHAGAAPSALWSNSD